MIFFHYLFPEYLLRQSAFFYGFRMSALSQCHWKKRGISYFYHFLALYFFFRCVSRILSGVTESLTDAFFESMSGFTTTGATIFSNVEAIPNGLLFWRATTQWLGGLAIIVLPITVLPFLGIGGMQLFISEAPGFSPEKLHPRVTGTIRRLWFVYLAITLILSNNACLR